MSEPVRVQKFLSSKGVCSRRTAEEWIRAGRLILNGNLVTLGDHMCEDDVLMLDGKSLTWQKDIPRRVLVWYKPVGIETTLARGRDGVRTLADMDFGGRVFPIGRLDKDSRGLLLLTNDGDLANSLAHPRYEHSKVYHVTLDKPCSDADMRRLRSGVDIGDDRKTCPCEIQRIKDTLLQITLHEGRNRQIRRMCEVLGYRVQDLLRVQFCGVDLGDLPAGEWRELSDAERDQLDLNTRQKTLQ